MLLPHTISNRIVKRRGSLQASVEAGEPNAETLIHEIGEDSTAWSRGRDERTN